MAEQLIPQVGANLLAGYQGAQQIQSNQQGNQLRAMQLQQAQQAQERDAQFRGQLGTYLQGGTNALAAMYQADPERAMQVQQFQVQQNKLAAEKDAAEAKRYYSAGQYLLDSKAPKELLLAQARSGFNPDNPFTHLVTQLERVTGKPIDELTDDEVVKLTEQAMPRLAVKAGIVPKYGAPIAGQAGGSDVFFQSDETSGRTRVLPGVSPRPQKPLVTVNTGDKANMKGEVKLAELEAQSYQKMLELGQTSEDQNSSLRAMMANPAITGPTQDFRAAANAFFADVGVPLSSDKVDQIANLGQYKAMQQSMVLNEQLKQTGPQTESDRKTIQETFGNTKSIREANELILKYKLAINDRNSKLAELAEKFRDDSGGIEGWRKELRGYVRSTPLAAKNPKTGRLVFWNEFADIMREDNPGMGDDEIMNLWRQKYAAGR